MMKAISFAELSKKVHCINDLIISDMVLKDKEDLEQKAVSYKKRLFATKCWFSRISCANKTRFLFVLLEEVRNVWTLSLLLKSLWNCRPKDAIMSVCEYRPWSSFDHVPFDHNRTALPKATLAQVMEDDRIWFVTLAPEPQAIVLMELLTIAGGPVLWKVLRKAQILYEMHSKQTMRDLLECVVINDPLPEKGQQISPEKGKKDQALGRKTSGTLIPNASRPLPGQTQKELEANLMAWNAAIKSIKESLKLEELEMTFKDGTLKRIWKVNRQKPEAMETVDFIQLLPSSMGKRILSYLPMSQLSEYARVNKYWAFLVDEYRSEINIRSRLDMDFEKLREIVLRHHTNNVDDMLKIQRARGIQSVVPPTKGKPQLSSTKARKKFPRSNIQLKPVRKMAELSERLDRLGATDVLVWQWCDNVIRHASSFKNKHVVENKNEGILPTENWHFPCPMMKKTVKVPLSKPLVKDPTLPTKMGSKDISHMQLGFK